MAASTSLPARSLVELLDACIRAAPMEEQQRGRFLARSFEPRIDGIGPPYGCSTTFYDSAVFRTRLEIGTSGELVPHCTCQLYRLRRTCEHIVALAMTMREDCLSTKPSVAIVTMRRSLAPPTPEQLLADVDVLLAPLMPAPAHTDLPSWTLLPNGDTLGLSLLVRPALKAGGTGKARPVTGASIIEALRQSPYEQDRALMAEFTRRYSHFAAHDAYLGNQLREDLKKQVSASLLARLAGHPELTWGAALEPAQIVELKPGLRVVEQGDVVRLCAVAGSYELTGKAVAKDDSGFVAWDSEARIAYACLRTDSSFDIFLKLAREPVTVPSSFAAALVERVAPVESKIHVDLPASLRGTEIEGDRQLRLILEPVGVSGVTASLRIRPIEGGEIVVPGAGRTRQSAVVANRRVTAARDLDDELERASRLQEALGLRHGPPEFSTTMLEEDALELLAKLEEAEFKDIPVEWVDKPAIQIARGGLKARRVVVKAQADWFDVEGDVEVDGDVLALADLFAAHRQQKRFVPLGKGRFAKVSQLMDARLERLAELTHDSHGKLALSRAAIADADTLMEQLELTAPLAWQQLAVKARRAKELDTSAPRGLRAELRDYQHEGYGWMRRLAELSCGAVLADDMGLGKTVQAIAMLVTRAPAGPQLVLAPTSVSDNWMRELARFAPDLRVFSLRDGRRQEVLDSVVAGDVVIASYGLLRSAREAITAVRWTSLVIDEAQAIKNWETATAKAVRAIPAEWKLALTGTPVENHLGELYSLLQTVLPGLFASWESFLRTYAVPIEKFGDKGRARALSRLVRPFILRRTKGEVLSELPARSEVRLDVVLPKPERRLYEAARVDALKRLSETGAEGDARFVALAALTRLRQLASCAHLVVPESPPISEKLRVLFERLEEILEEGHSALVFSQFVKQLDVVSAELKQRSIPHLVLVGETPAKERQARVDAFQRGEAKVFLVSLKAGGTGLNLTAADTVFLLDPWWNPAVEDQAADRAHRIGQTRAVTIVRLVAKDTVEEKVMSLHEKKRALIAGVLSDTDVAGRLSSTELVDLLREGQGAIEDDPEPEVRDEQQLRRPPVVIEAPRNPAELEAVYRRAFAESLNPQRLAENAAAIRALGRRLGKTGTIALRVERSIAALTKSASGLAPKERRAQAIAYEGLVQALSMQGHIDVFESDRLYSAVKAFRG